MTQRYNNYADRGNSPCPKQPEFGQVNPQFEDLGKPEAILNHLQELTETVEIEHGEILSRLLKQIELLDFEALANPHRTENFRIAQKHYVVLAVERILSLAVENRWGLCRNNGVIYLFNGAYWEELETDVFKNFLGKAAEKMGVPAMTVRHYKLKDELLKQFLSDAHLEPKLSSVDEVLINLRNGTFQLNGEKTRLRSFDSEDFLTYQLPFNYDPEATAPIFKKYLERVLPDPDSRKVLAEYMGYVFIKNGSKRLKAEKVLLIYGNGANGKSVFFDVITAMLGEQNVTHNSLQKLTEDKGRHRADIANKLLNYSSEMNGKLESSIFKQMASGEPIEAQKMWENPVTIRQYAKLIFNCNELPREVENTHAFFRRLLIIPFDVTIPPEEQDKQLYSKIIDNELSGVFNWVLEGLDRLLKQDGFTQCEAAEKAVKQYQVESDSVQCFIQEKGYRKSTEKFILIKELYSLYKEFCHEDGMRSLNKMNFKKRLSRFFEVKRISLGNAAFLTL
jgi:putative DNA primase/helicase